MDRLNPFPKNDADALIRKTVAVLDRYGRLYEQLSGGRHRDYASYMASDGFPDEDEFIKPKLFTDFLHDVLGFPPDEFVPEHARPSGVPDFQPTDVLLHPFFFEVKGSDSHDLTEHATQMHRYLRGPFAFGALLNMRDILVYDKAGLVTGRVSLLQLYRSAKDHPRDLLDRLETRSFLEFVARFRHQSLDRQTKIELIKNAPPPDTLPDIDPDELIATIHTVVRILTEDARKYAQDLDRRMKYRVFDQARRKLVAELVEIAGELDRRRVQTVDNDPGRFVNAREGSVERRAFEVFLTRVAYFTMTRFLIARMWEDVGFLEQRLYNGGFRKWYENQEHEIQRVLTDAFALAGRSYSWLFNESHNYFWYDPPSEDAIVDVLYEFAHYNLGRLDTDVLGTVYEQFVDKIDRKNKGQYYTPREVIRFIWDRVGFRDSDAFFRYEAGERHPVQILDVATGSGGFLVEAAQRLRTRTKYNPNDPDELLEILHSITGCLCGCEISLFAHYITEVNLLIQLTPVIRSVVRVCKHLPDTVRAVSLRTVPGDSLALIGARALFTNSITARDRPSELIEHDAKGPTRAEITNSFDFDFVCSNPPYVGEKGHKELFRDTRRNIPYWDKHYQGKMDYLYWFIMLGLAKLRPGGKLGFITTSYWPTADGASKLREYILENALIREIIDFGETRIFEGAPGQHNMVFVLEKCPSMKRTNSHPDGMEDAEAIARKKNHRIKIVKVKAVPPAKPQPGQTKPSASIARVIEHLTKLIGKDRHSDEYADVFLSPVKQGELDRGPWPLFASRESAETLARIEAAGTPLKSHWTVDQGVVPNPLRLTEAKLRALPPSVTGRFHLKVGDGVFVLTDDEVAGLALASDEQTLLRPYYKNSGIAPFVVDAEPPDSLIYATAATPIDQYPGIRAHLEKFEVILKERRECENGRIPWFSLHWAREERIFEGDKVVCSYRAEGAAFAFHHGSFYGSTDMYFIKPRDEKDKHSLKYLTGILNSRLMSFWLRNKGKTKGSATELFSTPVENLRIRRINFDDRAEVARHDKLVAFVDEMIAAKQALAKLNRFFGTRLTRLSSPTELPEPDVEAVTLALPDRDLRKVKNHPNVAAKPEGIADFVLSKVGDIAEAADLFTKHPDEHLYQLPLAGKGRKLLTVIAPKEVLKYLRDVFGRHIGASWTELRETPVARDLATYQAKEKEVVAEARSLLRKVASIQTKIDALVYELYGLTEEEIGTMEKMTSR
jgi:type I restriction-modification system DNA methylase subunit